MGEIAFSSGDAERGPVISICYIWIGTVGEEKIEEDFILHSGRSAICADE